ncbi:MAG: DUF484 family protein [Gammaproteobacteria bacterium]
MTRARTSKLEREALSEPAVEQYLLAHPDFFERHTGLLESLTIPHARGGAVSLVERQVAALRARNRQLERKLIDLVQVARDNESLSSRLHRLALALMEADGLQEVIATTRELLRSEFPSTQVVLKLFRNPRTALQASAHLLAEDDTAASLFDGLFKTKRPVAGLLADARVNYLFDAEVGGVASAVMVPLVDGKRLGVLALGSAEQDRFHVGMGTLFLGYLGELVSRAIGSHLGR